MAWVISESSRLWGANQQVTPCRFPFWWAECRDDYLSLPWGPVPYRGGDPLWSMRAFAGLVPEVPAPATRPAIRSAGRDDLHVIPPRRRRGIRPAIPSRARA